MKLVLDFDDVLFDNTRQFKKRIYACLEKNGIARNVAEDFYKKTREKQFSLKNFISAILVKQGIDKKMEDIYEEIMNGCVNFKNIELLKIVERIGKNNCYIVTNGDEDFQKDKIKKSIPDGIFAEIFFTSDTKKDILAFLCEKHQNDDVIFVDDRKKFFEDLDMKRCKNLKTILYDENGFEKLVAEIE